MRSDNSIIVFNFSEELILAATSVVGRNSMRRPISRRYGLASLLKSMASNMVLVCTDGDPRALEDALDALGCKVGDQWQIISCDTDSTCESVFSSAMRIVDGFRAQGALGAFVFGDALCHMTMAKEIGQAMYGSKEEVVSIALRGGVLHNEQLENLGADFVVSNFQEVEWLVFTNAISQTLSVILLAYNEEAVLEKAIADVHRFGQLYAPNYEIIVVDDGSTDSTVEITKRLCKDNVRLISHSTNQGMGASMRDGYRNAVCDFVVSLPADRQVKPHSLVAFLPHLQQGNVVLSQYVLPHSGVFRHLMSYVFRLILQHIGGLHVDFAGAYVFSRRFFEQIDLQDAAGSQTFLYSFQLLEAFCAKGAKLTYVDMIPFPREVGTSREATVRRVFLMAKEIARHRRLKNRHVGRK